MSSLAEVGIGVLAFYALGFVISLVVLWYTVRFIRYAWDGNTVMLKKLAWWALGLPVLALLLVGIIQWAQESPDQVRETFGALADLGLIAFVVWGIRHLWRKSIREKEAKSVLIQALQEADFEKALFEASAELQNGNGAKAERALKGIMDWFEDLKKKNNSICRFWSSRYKHIPLHELLLKNKQAWEYLMIPHIVASLEGSSFMTALNSAHDSLLNNDVENAKYYVQQMTEWYEWQDKQRKGARA